MRSLVVATAVLLPTLAVAEPGPSFAVGLDYTVGHGGHVENLDLGLRLEAGLFFRIGRWQATFSVPANPTVRSSNLERDNAEMVGVGVSGRLAYRAPLGGGILTIAAGLTRRWVYGDDVVMRTCAQTGDCIAGVTWETPSYRGWAPQLRIGIGPEKLMPSMVLGASLELIVETISLDDVPPDGIRNLTVMLGGTFTIGGGPSRP